MVKSVLWMVGHEQELLWSDKHKWEWAVLFKVGKVGVLIENVIYLV